MGARARNVHAINQCASNVHQNILWGYDWPMAPQSKPRGSNGCMSPIWGRRRESAQPHMRPPLSPGTSRGHTSPTEGVHLSFFPFHTVVGKQPVGEWSRP